MTAGIYISSHLHNDQQADTWYSGIHFIEIHFQGKNLGYFPKAENCPINILKELNSLLKNFQLHTLVRSSNCILNNSSLVKRMRVEF